MQSGLNVSVRLCVGREDLSLQCLPHRNISSTVLEKKKKKTTWVLWMVSVLVMMFYFTDLNYFVIASVFSLVYLQCDALTIEMLKQQQLPSLITPLPCCFGGVVTSCCVFLCVHMCVLKLCRYKHCKMLRKFFATPWCLWWAFTN